MDVVKAETYIKWVTSEGDDKWNSYVNNHDHLSIEWVTVKASHTGYHHIDMNNICPSKISDPTLTDFYIKTPPAHHSKVSVVLKHNNCNLLGLNDLLGWGITEKNLFSPDKGWMHRPDE